MLNVQPRYMAQSVFTDQPYAFAAFNQVAANLTHHSLGEVARRRPEGRALAKARLTVPAAISKAPL